MPKIPKEQLFDNISLFSSFYQIPKYSFCKHLLITTYVGEFGTDFVYQIIPAAAPPRWLSRPSAAGASSSSQLRLGLNKIDVYACFDDKISNLQCSDINKKVECCEVAQFGSKFMFLKIFLRELSRIGLHFESTVILTIDKDTNFSHF